MARVMSYLRGHHVPRTGLFVSAAAVALIGVCPAAALATTGMETVQATQADSTHVSVSLTDSDPSGTNPVNGLTFKTDGSLTSASVSGTSCSATGVGDAEYCSVTQAPGQTLDATLTVTKPVSTVNICGTTDGFVTTANTTCTDNTVNQPSAPPPPPPPPPGGTTPPDPVMDCDDFFAEKGPNFPTSIDPYKGAVVSLPFLIHNAGNCPTAADTRVKFTGTSPESERSGYRYLSPGVFALPSIASPGLMTTTVSSHNLVQMEAGNPFGMHVQLTFPPDTDPNGESGVDPAEGPSFDLAIGPYVAVSYSAGAANPRGMLHGTVMPGSPKAPNPVVKTQVAVQQLGIKGGKCHWLSKGKIVSRRANHGACDQPVWQNAPMTFKPKSVLGYQFPLPKALPHGRYEAIGRATLKSGVTNHTYPVRIDRVTFRR